MTDLKDLEDTAERYRRKMLGLPQHEEIETVINIVVIIIRVAALSLLCSQLNMPWWEALTTGVLFYLGFSSRRAA
jgi:hypothetical protein